MTRSIRWAILFLVLLAIIVVPFLLFGDAIEGWTQRTVRESSGGRLWAGFVLGGALATDILLPVPSSVVSTACGNLLGLWVGALTSLAGMTVSCLTGYWLGRRGGRPAARRAVGRDDLARLERWSQRFGDWMIVVARPVPVLAEASVLVAGMGCMRPARFFLVSLLANAGISIVYAAVGAYAAQANAFLPAFACSILLPGIAILATGRTPSPPPPRRLTRSGSAS